MNKIALWFVLFLIFRSIANNIIVYFVLKEHKRHRQPEVNLEGKKKLILLLKVFQETQLIEETIEYIMKHIEYSDKIHLMIVGSARERSIEGTNPTLDLAQNFINRNQQVTILESPSINGSHATQNNFALKFISSIYDPESTWILTLDIDSRFSSNGLYAFIDSINKNHPIIQQSSLFISNFARLGYLQKSHALYQSHWTIAHEVKRILVHNITKLSIAHVVGHGLCAKLSILQEFGGFPEETMIEDINLGFYFVATGKDIVPLNIFELSDNPITVLDGIKQEYVWSFGALNYPVYFWYFMQKFPLHFKRNILRTYLITVQGIISYVDWLISSWYLMAILLWAFWGNFPAQLYLMLYLLEFVQCAYYFWSSGYIGLSDLLLSPVMAIISSIRRSIGADMALFDVLVGRKINKFKTRHS